MRRMATVTRAAPLAACAARMISTEGYLPVPTINRELNSYLPIFNVSDVTLPSRDRFDDLEAVAVAQTSRIVLVPPHDAIVTRHGDAGPGRAEKLEQSSHGQLVGELTGSTVNRCLHALVLRFGAATSVPKRPSANGSSPATSFVSMALAIRRAVAGASRIPLR